MFDSVGSEGRSQSKDASTKGEHGLWVVVEQQSQLVHRGSAVGKVGDKFVGKEADNKAVGDFDIEGSEGIEDIERFDIEGCEGHFDIVVVGKTQEAPLQEV